jgi:hypothetical protein
MFITDLTKMETLVSTEKYLSWDGWTVVERIPTNKGYSSTDGVFANGKWNIEKRFAPTREGWKIPGKYTR